MPKEPRSSIRDWHIFVPGQRSQSNKLSFALQSSVSLRLQSSLGAFDQLPLASIEDPRSLNLFDLCLHW